MLYSSSESFSVEVLPLENPFLIPEDADYVHFHWINTLWKYSGKNKKDFLKIGFEEFFNNWDVLGSNTKFIWTCHDGLSFDNDCYLEIPLINELVAQVDIMHVLGEQTIELLETHTTVDRSKIIVVPHSSFEGVLTRVDIDKSIVKSDLGIPNDSIVIGFLGQIRVYKGLDTLLKAFDESLDQFPMLFLLIGGNNWMPDSINFENLSAISNRFLLVDHFLTDSEFSNLANVIDIAIYPYERILNSGSLFSSATMGHHVIVPNFKELNFRPALEFVSYFDPGNHEDLTRVLQEVITTESYKESREKAILYSKNNSPQAMSQNFFAKLLALE
jgi:glycosyltransferase involved in cell wall biosynthesis